MPTANKAARLGVINGETARPFINAFKQAWSWQADWGGAQWDALVAAGHMTPGGQLISIPPGSGGFRTRLFHNMPAEAGGSGRHRLRWDGTFTIDLHGARNITRVSPNEIQFDFTANGSSWIDLIVRTIDPAGGPIENISLVHQDDWADADRGKIFRRQYLTEIAPYHTLRFDEWIGILTSENQGGLRITDWASRALPTDEIFHRFVPYEWMAALCREVDAAMWLCLPTAATDDHMRQCAALIRDLMPAPRQVYVEYSTKTWDFSGTPQAHYCAARGREAFGTSTGAEFRNWYGMRSVQMAQIWRRVWGGDERLHTVVQHQADWVGGEADILLAPLWRDRSGTRGLPVYVAPHSVIDMLTVHAQIDGGMAYGGRASQLEGWRNFLSQGAAFDRIRDQMLTGSAWGADRTVRSLVPKWRHYRTEASKYGMELGAYEVGNHMNGVGGSSALRAFIHAFSVSPQMGEVYAATFAALDAAGFDGPLAMSVECRMPDQNICHGLQRWLGDRNPAWAAVRALIEDAPVTVPESAPVPDREPIPTPAPVPEPIPTPVPVPVDPTPEEPDMSARQKLTELLSVLQSTTADLQTYLAADPVVTPPDVVPPVVLPVSPPIAAPAGPIWDQYKQPVLNIPAEITVPAGAADIYIPVSVNQCDRNSFMAYVDRLVNLTGGSINVGSADSQRAKFAGMDVVYHWSPGDDVLHWIKITPRDRHADGQAFQVSIRVKGLGDKQKGRTVKVRFSAAVPTQVITQPFHRPLRRLDLSRATRKNTFDPATLTHNPTGDGGNWMSALSHGRSQDGNQETGLYADASIAGADNPISYDAAEKAIRLHSVGYANRVEWDKRNWSYQAAVLQGLHRGDVCGVEGVWRIEAKIPVRRYSWPAFWLVNRSKASAGFYYSQWPGEIDILEKFNHAWGAADTPYTSSFAQHFGPINEWQNKKGAFGNDFEVDQYGSPRTPLDEVYTSWAVHVAYDPVDTTKSEVTFFVNDREVGCQILHARHQDLARKVEFYPIFNVAVKTPSGYTPERYNTDDGRGRTGDMLVRDVAYYPTGAQFT